MVEVNVFGEETRILSCRVRLISNISNELIERNSSDTLISKRSLESSRVKECVRN